MSKAAEERRKEKEAATLAQLAAQEKRAEEVRPAFPSFHDQDDQDDDAHVRVICFSIIVLKENSLLALFEKSKHHLVQSGTPGCTDRAACSGRNANSLFCSAGNPTQTVSFANKLQDE